MFDILNKKLVAEEKLKTGLEYIAQAIETQDNLFLINAVESFIDSIENFPSMIEPYIAMGEVFLQLELFENAKNILLQAKEISSDNEKILNMLNIIEKFQHLSLSSEMTKGFSFGQMPSSDKIESEKNIEDVNIFNFNLSKPLA